MNEFKCRISKQLKQSNGDYLGDFFNCLYFAAEAHIKQKRKDFDKTPYINHPIGVAHIIVNEGGIVNLDLIRASLLHDTVEDTEVTMEKIYFNFGDYVGNIVQEVTDDKSLPKETRKDLQILHGPNCSLQAKIVKLADKLYNLRDLEQSLPLGWTEERRCEYFEWAFQVCEGLRGVSRELEVKLEEIFKGKGLLSKVNIAEYENTSHWSSHNELKPLIAAANFAAVKHKSHFVLNYEKSAPYINHIISSALSVYTEAGLKDVNMLTAALLKDVVGKSDTNLAEVIDEFGNEVGRLVEELSFEHSSSWDEHFKRQMSGIKNMSFAGKVITTAALLDNCRRLEDSVPLNWTKSMCEAYFTASYQMCTTLVGIPSNLVEELNKIWVAQGLKETRTKPMSSTEMDQSM